MEYFWFFRYLGTLSQIELRFLTLFREFLIFRCIRNGTTLLASVRAFRPLCTGAPRVASMPDLVCQFVKCRSPFLNLKNGHPSRQVLTYRMNHIFLCLILDLLFTFCIGLALLIGVITGFSSFLVYYIIVVHPVNEYLH